MKTVILVGFRSKIVEACERLQLAIVLIHDKTIPSKYQDKITKFLKINFHDFNLDKLITEISSLNVTCIIPLIERGVVLASILNQKLFKKGLTKEQALICHDKVEMKKFFSENRIPITPYSVITPLVVKERIVSEFGFPLVVKKSNLSGGKGQKIVNTIEELNNCWKQNSIVEKFVKGREYSVEAFIKNGVIIFKNITYYYLNHAINVLPAILNEKITRELFFLVEKIVKLLKLDCGMIHAEFFLTDSDEIIVGEIASRPPGGFIMELISSSYSFNAWELYLKLFIESDIPVIVSCNLKFSSVIIFHPGEGKFDLYGVEELEKTNEVVRFMFKFKNGMKIKNRESSGEYVGYVILESLNYKKLIEVTESIRQKIKFSPRAETSDL